MANTLVYRPEQAPIFNHRLTLNDSAASPLTTSYRFPLLQLVSSQSTTMSKPRPLGLCFAQALRIAFGNALAGLFGSACDKPTAARLAHRLLSEGSLSSPTRRASTICAILQLMAELASREPEILWSWRCALASLSALFI